MPNAERELYRSANGSLVPHWDDGKVQVLHKPSACVGGRPSRLSWRLSGAGCPWPPRACRSGSAGRYPPIRHWFCSKTRKTFTVISVVSLTACLSFERLPSRISR
jgi:hypothetical protein